MKKYNIFLFFSIAISSLFFSCSSELDLDTDGRIDVSGIFNNRYETMGWLNSSYGFAATPTIDRASYCDEAEDCNDYSGSRSNWYNGAVTSSNYSSNSVDGQPWSSLYQGIRKCNIFLAHIDSAKIYVQDDERAGWTAQAHTLRAYYYLQLVKRYGSVPLVLNEMPVGYDFSKATKSKFSDVVKVILADCDSALAAPISETGFPWIIYAGQSGIMSRAVTYAIKSEAITYACSDLFSDGTYTWDDALAINKEALYQCLTNDYSLFNVQPTSNAAQNPYALYFITSSNDQRSVDKETIYQGGGQQSIWSNAGMPSTAGMTKSGPCPTQELVDSYETKDGQPVLSLDQPYDNNHNPIYNTSNTLYNQAYPYKNRDPRLTASIYYNGANRNLNATTVGQKFTATAPFYGVGEMCSGPKAGTPGTWGLTMNLYKWDTDYATSVSGIPVADTTFVNFTNNSICSIDLTTPLPAGSYVWELTLPVGAVGTYQYKTATATTASYFKGALQTYYLRSYIANTYTYSSTLNKNVYAYTLMMTNNVTQTGVSLPVDYRYVCAYDGGVDAVSLSSSDNTHTRTGYYMAKANNYLSSKTGNSDGAIRVFRLPELYMNFAESAYQATGNSPYTKITLGSGLTMSAADAVNAVRARAGMPNLPTTLTSGKGGTFEQRYRNERRVEFAFEGHRFFDVRRWKILSTTDNMVSGMRIDATQTKYTRFNFSQRQCTSDKWLLYPIDQTEANKFQAATGVNWQNTGW